MKLRRDVFQAISDPTRREILVILTSQAMTAGVIASNFDTARPTISKHIQILNECGLVEANQQGRKIYYQLKIEKMKEVDDWLEQFRQLWENRFDQLDDLLMNVKKPKHEE